MNITAWEYFSNLRSYFIFMYFYSIMCEEKFIVWGIRGMLDGYEGVNRECEGVWPVTHPNDKRPFFCFIYCWEWKFDKLGFIGLWLDPYTTFALPVELFETSFFIFPKNTLFLFFILVSYSSILIVWLLLFLFWNIF